eukprot:5088511-Amphidinium_carterae.2
MSTLNNSRDRDLVPRLHVGGQIAPALGSTWAGWHAEGGNTMESGHKEWSVFVTITNVLVVANLEKESCTRKRKILSEAGYDWDFRMARCSNPRNLYAHEARPHEGESENSFHRFLPNR